MKFRIIDGCGNVVDHDLTYEEALMWMDSHDSYSIEPMKEGDQNDSRSM